MGKRHAHTHPPEGGDKGRRANEGGVEGSTKREERDEERERCERKEREREREYVLACLWWPTAELDNCISAFAVESVLRLLCAGAVTGF
jgi:hypothetical protein